MSNTLTFAEKLRTMKIVFMGTPHFAVPALQSIHEAHQIAAVITAPDRPAGRGKKIRTSPVKDAALQLGLDVWQPTNLKDPEFQDRLKALGADVFVVVAFRMLPDAVWQLPPLGTINLHASLLPRYRGAAPINRAIMAGEETTGLTTFFIRREIDTGAILERRKMKIGPDETAGELHDRMMETGAELLISTLEAVERGAAKPIPQEDLLDEFPPSAAPKIFKQDRMIDWTRSARDIHNHIRGLSPYPGAVAQADDGTEFKILRSTPVANHEAVQAAKPGTARNHNGRLWVSTGDGVLEITRLQPPGKKPLEASDFLRGHRAEQWNFHTA